MNRTVYSLKNQKFSRTLKRLTNCWDKMNTTVYITDMKADQLSYVWNEVLWYKSYVCTADEEQVKVILAGMKQLKPVPKGLFLGFRLCNRFSCFIIPARITFTCFHKHLNIKKYIRGFSTVSLMGFQDSFSHDSISCYRPLSQTGKLL